MNRETILQRIEQLKAARRDQEAQLHGLDGAIQDCMWWLRQLEETQKADGTAEADEAGKEKSRLKAVRGRSE